MPEIENLFTWILLGGVAGWIASIIKGTRAQMGLSANIIVGIIGAFIGGWLLGLLGVGPATGFNLPSIFVAVVGAVVLLTLLNAVGKK